jgi:hypothetical protein
VQIRLKGFGMPFNFNKNVNKMPSIKRHTAAASGSIIVGRLLE